MVEEDYVPFSSPTKEVQAWILDGDLECIDWYWITKGIRCNGGSTCIKEGKIGF